MNLTLIRVADTPWYTTGRIEDAEHRQICVTLERPWVDKDHNSIGDQNESRIPAGVYQCHRTTHHPSGPNPYEVWCLEKVPGRSDIHIHRGSRVEHSLGCVLVGVEYGPKGTITEPAVAFAKLMRLTEGQSAITLTVVDVPPLKAVA